MTKKELEQIYHINHEIRMWEEEREKLESRLGGTGKWLDGMPKCLGISDATGNLATEIASCKLMISCKELELQMQKNKVIKYIDSIDDSLIRQIIFYRCVSIMPWSKVADKIGGNATYDSVRKAFERYIK